MANTGTLDRHRSDGFTLIELLVVVAIIALLLSILLPSLQKARAQAKAVLCATNQHSIGQAIHSYLSEQRGQFPVAYQYLDVNGNTVDTAQPAAGGYLHWSYALFNDGEVPAESFRCPEFENGGNPRTNPGPDGGDWEDQQVDQNGDSSPNELTDHQAPRMAYTANAAIMPRNKFNTQMSFGPRINRLVRDNEIIRTGEVIMVTEFNRNWRGEALPQGSAFLSKSHRPINPFWHSGSGFDEYASMAQGFHYGQPGDPTYGLASLNAIQDASALIVGSRGSELNAVGRHHPGGDKYGGTANFLYTDGHVERETVHQTMANRRWGERYYSVTGDNTVVDRYGELP